MDVLVVPDVSHAFVIFVEVYWLL